MSHGPWKPWPVGEAHRLSRIQRDLLIEHCVGPQLYIAGSSWGTSILLLMQRGLLKGDIPGKPHFTELTTLGKQVVCTVLGEYADALTKAGPDYKERLLPQRKMRSLDGDDIRQEPPAE